MRSDKEKRSKLICNVGINDANYKTHEYMNVGGKYKVVWGCPFYDVWVSMLKRCYSEKVQSRQPTYKGCIVCEEWLIFSNFKAWMETQDWEGKQLDKDLLKEGNKVYCPEYCIFVDGRVNKFVTDRSNYRGEYMLGVNLHKPTSKFKARCCNTFTNEREYLGLFATEIEAHLAWKARKHELACMLADSEYCNDPRLAEALRTRYL